MVHLSKTIANKIREKQGDITEDEVSYFAFNEIKLLLSLCRLFFKLINYYDNLLN